jgi:hypothetical protein
VTEVEGGTYIASQFGNGVATQVVAHIFPAARIENAHKNQDFWSILTSVQAADA